MSRILVKISNSYKRCVGSAHKCADEAVEMLLGAVEDSMGKLPMKSSSISLRAPVSCELLALIEVVILDNDGVGIASEVEEWGRYVLFEDKSLRNTKTNKGRY